MLLFSFCRDRSAETGSISCRVCGESFQSRITALSDPIDVYCDWIDACDQARSGAGDSSGLPVAINVAAASGAGVGTGEPGE
jgi:transcription elongation factor Elf1